MKPAICYSIFIASLFLIAGPLRAEETPVDLKAHEWGTITTLHSPSGSSLAWYQPNQRGVSELPSFVYPRIIVSSKGGMLTTARMETPVIYFYTDTKQSVDLSVSYLDGKITEYFPRTDRVYPSGPSGDWKGLELIPPSHARDGMKFPVDPKLPKNHYYEARAVPDAALVQRMDQPDEVEKFVFYRGAGSFESGLHVRMDLGGEGISVSSYNESDPIEHGWLLQSSVDAVRWKKLLPLPARKGDSIPPQTQVPFSSLDAGTSRVDSIANLKASMVAALTDTGLTSAEASAMVATWDEQWFEEPGQRVFSIVPQAVIDVMLPLQITPKPSEMIRVFVHRAEVIRPETLHNLETSMSPETDPARAKALIAEAQLGRFIHGVLESVASEVGRRTAGEYRMRGFQALQSDGKATEVSSVNARTRPSK